MHTINNNKVRKLHSLGMWFLLQIFGCNWRKFTFAVLFWKLYLRCNRQVNILQDLLVVIKISKNNAFINACTECNICSTYVTNTLCHKCWWLRGQYCINWNSNSSTSRYFLDKILWDPQRFRASNDIFAEATKVCCAIHGNRSIKKPLKC